MHLCVKKWEQSIKSQGISDKQVSKSFDYSKLMSDEWCAKLAYLSDMCHYLNELNTQMQDQNENLVQSTDKLIGFYFKVQLWQQHVQCGNLEMLLLTKKLQDCNTAAMCEVIGTHLKTLEEKLSFFFFFSFHRMP